MANITTPIPDIVTRTRSVQDHIDELPIWADGTKLPSVPMTGMQWLIWSLAAAGKFFEGYVVFMTGVAMPLFSREFEMRAFEHGMIGAASLFGILDRRGHSWRVVRSFRPQADVRRRDDHLRCVPRGAVLRHELHPGGDLPVRARARARLRLPDSAHDHLGKHSEFQARQARARRIRLPGRRRARRNSGRFFRPLGPARTQRLALDVRERDHSSRARHARSLLHRRERQLVVRAWRTSTRRSGRRRGSWCASRNILRRSSSRRQSPKEQPRRVTALPPCSTAKTGAPRSWRRSPGSCRTWEPMASAFSPRPSWLRRSAAARITRAASPT